MRNTIYISILAILIILSGCKGNSFLNQRYTNFSRGHQHVKVKEGVALRQEKAKPVMVQSAEAIPTEASNVEPAKLVAIAVQNQIVLENVRHFKKLPVPAAQNNLSKGTELNHQATAVTLSQKSTGQKKQVFKAIIGELLSIVLYLILLCILVAAIVLLIILL